MGGIFFMRWTFLDQNKHVTPPPRIDLTKIMRWKTFPPHNFYAVEDFPPHNFYAVEDFSTAYFLCGGAPHNLCEGGTCLEGLFSVYSWEYQIDNV